MEIEKPFGPALAALEMSSLAAGYSAMDLLVKKAPVRILEGSAMTPGKFVILFNGDEASVEESYKEILAQTQWGFLDHVLIPQLEGTVLPALYGLTKVECAESLCIVETASMASGLVSADASVKYADVKLIEIRSSRGIGGKCLYFVTGSLDAVQAAQETVQSTLQSRGTLLRTEVIARPHKDFLRYFNISGADA